MRARCGWRRVHITQISDFRFRAPQRRCCWFAACTWEERARARTSPSEGRHRAHDHRCVTNNRLGALAPLAGLRGTGRRATRAMEARTFEFGGRLPSRPARLTRLRQLFRVHTRCVSPARPCAPSKRAHPDVDVDVGARHSSANAAAQIPPTNTRRVRRRLPRCSDSKSPLPPRVAFPSRSSSCSVGVPVRPTSRVISSAPRPRAPCPAPRPAPAAGPEPEPSPRQPRHAVASRTAVPAFRPRPFALSSSHHPRAHPRPWVSTRLPAGPPLRSDDASALALRSPMSGLRGAHASHPHAHLIGALAHERSPSAGSPWGAGRARSTRTPTPAAARPSLASRPRPPAMLS